jgi:HlyD family secretion protein
MARRFRLRPVGSVRLVFLLSFPLAVAMMAAAWSGTGPVRGRDSRPPAVDLPWVVVKRDDLETTLLAGGDLQPIKQATITCQVEDITEAEGMLILSVIRNGSPVKKGDEICRLDSSELEEMARREEIQVGVARASSVQAKLAYETATIALKEYREGLITQTTKEFEGRLALGRSDTQRQADRVAWAEAMEVKGYLSRSQLSSERQALALARHELRKTEGEFQLFRKFEIPKEIQTFKGQIEAAEINKRLESDRLKVEEERLAFIRKQIDNCTVRAPQDGVVVYANGNKWYSKPLEPGVRVYQDQVMFVLPDLSLMEVEVSVHESMGPRVRVGMKANVRLASVAERILRGRVVSIDTLSSPNVKMWDERLRHFLVRVRLDETPASALPFMSAAVEIDTGGVRDALVIPVEALALVDGQQSCYVVADDGLERRVIRTRRATIDLLEVTEGLHEGERVILRSLEVDQRFVKDRPRDSPGAFARDQTASPTSHESSPLSTPQA